MQKLPTQKKLINHREIQQKVVDKKISALESVDDFNHNLDKMVENFKKYHKYIEHSKLDNRLGLLPLFKRTQNLEENSLILSNNLKSTFQHLKKSRYNQNEIKKRKELGINSNTQNIQKPKINKPYEQEIIELILRIETFTNIISTFNKRFTTINSPFSISIDEISYIDYVTKSNKSTESLDHIIDEKLIINFINDLETEIAILNNYINRIDIQNTITIINQKIIKKSTSN